MIGYYCNLKLTGTVNFTRTGLPRCIPGFHLGMDFMSRIASLSSEASPPERTTTHQRDCVPVTHKLADNTTWIPFLVLKQVFHILGEVLNNFSLPSGDSGCSFGTVEDNVSSSSSSSILQEDD